ncbi:PPOX class F420-dependent oxidoreductase [Nocardia terpenica]|uniref:PPOX class F420-dependent enzyme n=1 Tax=Nocardia terpenica TaxID=455432 RepID=A0A164M3F7_9NOCA|nr:PPOX class F420-dependent oxidoreductase [Nocardia terpenica]KZM72996.1 PPOX class F420-dependent enzyme [Nocardia terpenica]MBF6061053.1 PPOX class F420-dependent oxidoreductase [Nocardia terpenica]MBF6108735.1 PPOX class F420-dependent oxidoreductase [Nocardia terpenica]MBF6114079.1 PPOX class F420-dependent oxidoreductase [Nocardia terpenica]MBF6120297.1 PPOX class F420-dependent oxidoreductase [Nocardia terpenica]
MDNPFGAAGTSNYVLLTTFRRNGTPVGTPVWAVLDEGRLLVWTVADSGKVKRLRNNPTVALQPCTVGGKARGAVVDGTARILDEAGAQRVRRLIKRKYSVQGWLVVTGSLIRRGRGGTVGIEITAEG